MLSRSDRLVLGLVGGSFPAWLGARTVPRRELLLLPPVHTTTRQLCASARFWRTLYDVGLWANELAGLAPEAFVFRFCSVDGGDACTAAADGAAADHVRLDAHGHCHVVFPAAAMPRLARTHAVLQGHILAPSPLWSPSAVLRLRMLLPPPAPAAAPAAPVPLSAEVGASMNEALLAMRHELQAGLASLRLSLEGLS
jgi:hypothetical protein